MPCVKGPIQKSMHHFHHYSTLERYKKWKETVTIRFLITISDLQLMQIKIQEDHNIHTYFFILFSCFSCRKFEKTLVTCNV